MSKNLVNQIRILAQDAGPKGAPKELPKSEPDTSVNNSTITNQDAGPKGKRNLITKNPKYVVKGDASFKKMQLEMIKLSDIISNQIDFKTMLQGMQNPQNADMQGREKTFGRSSFSNFMVGSYLRNSDVKGVEFDPDPKKSNINQKTPSDLKNMFIVLDSIKRVGSGSKNKEFSDDGVWGPRTNNSLKNIIALTDAILRLSTDLDFPMKSYTNSNLNQLKGLIPSDKLIPLKETNENYKLAEEITKHLQSMGVLFKEFNENILNSPYNKQQIEGAPFITYKKTQEKTEPNFSDDEKAIHSDLVVKKNESSFANHPDAKFTVNLGAGQSFVITAADLLNAQSLDAWANKNTTLKAWRQDIAHWTTVLKEIVKQVRQQVDAKLVSKVPAPKGT
mgnify:CR=1 FL=1